MANADGKCIVCGKSPTIKAHLFPRALMKDLKGDGKAVFQGSRRYDGVEQFQNGQWDDKLLCAEHEKLGSYGEEYAIRLLRGAQGASLPKTEYGASILENPEPDKLTHFVYSVLWKFANSIENPHLVNRLGPYNDRLKAIVFDGAPHNLDVIVTKRRYHIEGQSVDFVIPPFKTQLTDLNIWVFSVGGLTFNVKLDNRPTPREWRRFIANGQTKLIFSDPPARDVMKIEKLRPIIERTVKERPKKKR